MSVRARYDARRELAQLALAWREGVIDAEEMAQHSARLLDGGQR